ncbi:hypothetical protein [Dyadobacter sp. CY356]|uniref:hypothetical protein n=1 Tax=Dyadobacter sp. CY356 TaxID=2906442 RepID=UPI001F1D6828|nr:hypothetical protein [Dyadobacter sp. CY356]MCF0058372.1 hypothetical protein [Dyadobacter sp. CY356]
MALYNFTRNIQLNWNILKSFLYIIPLLAIQSCNDSTTDPINTYDYFPLTVGHYMIYDVNEAVYSSGQANPVIKAYQEKDEISSVTVNTDGSSTYIVSRSSRNTSADYWVKTKKYSINQFPDKLIFNIDNQSTVPLVFPIDSKITWNGNMYNTLDAEDYHYEEINQPSTLGSLSFDKTLTLVEIRDTTSVIDYNLGLKRFAIGVGLIYDEQTSYEYCQATAACIGQGIIDSGSKKTRKIIEYGPKSL